jgi:hypothetical protein
MVVKGELKISLKCILYLLDLRGVIDVDAYYLLDLMYM